MPRTLHVELSDTELTLLRNAIEKARNDAHALAAHLNNEGWNSLAVAYDRLAQKIGLPL